MANTESARLILQSEAASVSLAAQASARNWTKIDTEDLNDRSNCVSEGWSLVRTTTALDRYGLGSTQTMMGFKLGECTDLYTRYVIIYYITIYYTIYCAIYYTLYSFFINILTNTSTFSNPLMFCLHIYIYTSLTHTCTPSQPHVGLPQADLRPHIRCPV
jgi:hypothetical protein